MAGAPHMDIRSNVREFMRSLSAVEREQLPFAMSLAINMTADQVIRDNQGEMQSRLDRPTRFTLNSQRKTFATRRNPSSTISFKRFSTGTSPGVYMRAIIEGGPRGQKAFELAMERKGLLDRGMRLVPGRDARPNAYGNLTRATYTRIIRGAGPSNTRTGRQMPRVQGSGAGTYFTVTARDSSALPPGVWQRMASGRLRQILRAVPSASYSKIFDWPELSAQSARKRFPFNMERAMAQALRTARPR